MNVYFTSNGQPMALLKEPKEHTIESEKAAQGGSKHANLVRLEQITQGMEGVEVPISRALFTENVKFFLEREAPEVFESLEKLKGLYLENSEHFFDQAIVQQILEEIQARIKEAFRRYPEDLLPREIFDHRGYLMVRSSGSEDGKIANAGGNVSIAYVKPELGEILAAIGEVEASYFSVNSLQNRMNGGENPFEAPLRLGVLIQPLIGEEVGGGDKREEIPVSMVLFTNEPSYIGNEKFRVMRINAAYGHGEGVVGNKGISQDTLFVLQSHVNPHKIYVVYNNQVKLERLVPMQKEGKIVLEPLLNEEGMREHPVLSYEEIQRLFDLGCKVEEDYQTPMDMEIVVKNGVIYPVQARPIHRKQAKPTFVDHSICEEGIRASKVLVPGDLSARMIANPRSVLIAPTLEEVEKQFNREMHQFVVVAQDEPAQSHPVVNFSGMGIPCFYVEDIEKVKALSDQIGERKLLVCVQEGTMSLWSGDEDHPPFKEGYTAHPAPISVTCIDSSHLLSLKNVKNHTIPQELKEALIHVRNPNTRESALNALAESHFLREAWYAAKTLKNRVSHARHVSNHVTTTIDAIDRLNQKICRATSELFVSAQGNNELEILFHVKTLQQLIMQESGGVGQLSLIRLPKFVTAVHTALDYQEKLSFSGTFEKEALLGDEAISPRIREHWNTYLERLENLIHENPSKAPLGEKLQKLLSIIEKTNSGPSWINLFFAVSFEKERDVETLTKTLLEGFSEESTFLDEMLFCQKKIQSEMANIGSFQQESTFHLAFERLKKLSLSFQGGFPKKFQTAAPIEKLIAQGIFQEMIGLFDKAIKTAKASSFMNEALFKEMIIENFKMLAVWGDERSFSAYLQDLECDIQACTGLSPSRNFSVQAATFGSKVAMERHNPETSEDCFTLVHQNLLALLERIGKEFLPENFKEVLDLPETFSSMMAHTEKVNGKLTRLTVGDGKIKVMYNIPLQNHSAALVLEHDFKDNRDAVQVCFYGERRNRWDLIAASFESFNAMNGCTLIGEPSITEQEVGVTAQCDHDKVDALFDMIQCTLDVSMGNSTRLNKFMQCQFRNYPCKESWFEKMKNLANREGRKGEFAATQINAVVSTFIEDIRQKDISIRMKKEKFGEFFALMDSNRAMWAYVCKQPVISKPIREMFEEILTIAFTDDSMRKMWEKLTNEMNSLVLNYMNQLELYFIKGVPKGDFEWAKERCPIDLYKEMLCNIIPYILKNEELMGLWTQLVEELPPSFSRQCNEEYKLHLSISKECESCFFDKHLCFSRLKKLCLNQKEALKKILPHCLKDKELRLLWESEVTNLQSSREKESLYIEYLTTFAKMITPQEMLVVLKRLTDELPEIATSFHVKQVISRILVDIVTLGVLEKEDKKLLIYLLRNSVTQYQAKVIYMTYLATVQERIEKGVSIETLQFLQTLLDEELDFLTTYPAEDLFVSLIDLCLPAACSDDLLFSEYEKLINKAPPKLQFKLLKNLIQRNPQKGLHLVEKHKEIYAPLMGQIPPLLTNREDELLWIAFMDRCDHPSIKIRLQLAFIAKETDIAEMLRKVRSVMNHPLCRVENSVEWRQLLGLMEKATLAGVSNRQTECLAKEVLEECQDIKIKDTCTLSLIKNDVIPRKNISKEEMKEVLESLRKIQGYSDAMVSILNKLFSLVLFDQNKRECLKEMIGLMSDETNTAGRELCAECLYMSWNKVNSVEKANLFVDILLSESDFMLSGPLPDNLLFYLKQTLTILTNHPHVQDLSKKEKFKELQLRISSLLRPPQ